MGSFNTTCAISHSPITPGDKVRLFFLASQAGFSDDPQKNILSIGCQCYPWDDFKVIGGISLQATYDDYNSYSFDENSIFSKMILEHIKNNYLENVSEEGKEYNEYHDHMDVNVNDLDWQKVLNMIHSGRLYLKGYGRGVKPAVAMMAIHEPIYDIMMKETYEQYKRDSKNYKDSYYVTIGFEDFLKENLDKYAIKEDNESWKKFYEFFEDKVKDGTMTQDQAIKKARHMAELHKDMERDHDCTFVFESRSIVQSLRNFSIKIRKEKDTDKKIEITEYTDNDLISKHAESIYFNERMMTHNFMYRPLMTSGQEYDHISDGVFWQKISNALLTKTDSYEEDEHVVTKKCSIQWQEINLSDILNRLEEWFDEPEDLQEQKDLLKKVLDSVSEGQTLIIPKSEMKDEKYKNLMQYIWNKELDLHIKIDKQI